MILALQRLLDPAYLYSLNLESLGQWGAIYVTWAVLLGAGLVLGLWWRHRTHTEDGLTSFPTWNRPWVGGGERGGASAAVVAAACAVGLLAVLLRLLAPGIAGLPLFQGLSPAARLLLLEAWTARVWPLSATLVALAATLLGPLSHRTLPTCVQRHVEALLGQRSETGLSRLQTALLAALHGAGLAGLFVLGERSWLWALPSLLALAALSWLPRPRRLRLETLAPLFPAYLAALANATWDRSLQIDVRDYRAFALPDPWSPWFYVEALVAGGLAYTLWIQARALLLDRWPVSREHGSRRGWMLESGLPLALGLLTVLWLLATVVVHRTHGVTASDPYAYTQMAIDLAERGTPQHTFPIAALARDLGLPTWPTVHIGYHPPGPDNRAPTMWSIGWPLLLAPIYRIGGLEAIYWAAPLVGLLSLLATALLVDEALNSLPRGIRWSAAALCCALVATSPEGSERLLVPMADAAAQLFTVLMLWLLLRGGRVRTARAAVLHGTLAGVCFGAAYWVRHPLLPLGAAAVAALFGSLRVPLFRARRDRVSTRSDARGEGRETRSRKEPGGKIQTSQWALLGSFALAALLIALPDLAYHKTTYGGWLASESSEWFLISARNVGGALSSVLQQGLLRREETGYLAPLVLYGAWLLWRHHRRAAAVLGAAFLAVFAFHLLYEALRPRDLIAVLPLLYLCAAYGWVNAWRRLRWLKTPGAAILLVCLTVLLLARSTHVLSLPWRTGVTTFGHVPATQAAAFERLGELTPENAVIGSMLNSGAIELHAGRTAIHPSPWTEVELYTWTDALLAQGRPFYLLDDGEEMPLLIDRMEPRYRLQPVATLGLPYFALGGGNLPRPARLYEVLPPGP